MVRELWDPEASPDKIRRIIDSEGPVQVSDLLESVRIGESGLVSLKEAVEDLQESRKNGQITEEELKNQTDELYQAHVLTAVTELRSKAEDELNEAEGELQFLPIAFSGFHSKDAIVATGLAFIGANPAHFLLFLLPLLTAGLTAFYMFRLWFFTFAGEPRDQHIYDHAHESPRIMTIPLLVLALFAAFVAMGGERGSLFLMLPDPTARVPFPHW